MNLTETLDKIAMTFRDPYIIAIDACLGQLSSVGNIQFCDGPVKPGAGVNKELPPVGNVHITGVVNVGGFMEYFVLQNTRLSLVFEMAEVITSGLYHAMLLAPKAAATSARLE
jgi:putative sporulation protein YyaC